MMKHSSRLILKISYFTISASELADLAKQDTFCCLG